MSGTATWLAEAVSVFGAASKDKLSGPGDREAAIRSPLDALLSTIGAKLGVPATLHDEVQDRERQVRPDYGVIVSKAIIGYVEVKAPGKSINPNRFTGHDKRQWDRQKDLPNLLYTNGTAWRLFRGGVQVEDEITFTGDLSSAGAALSAPAEFETMASNFLRWEPAPITSVGRLVNAVAPLTRLLRGEVLDQLAAERRAVEAGADQYDQPFLGLAADWRALLFPHANDQTFADGYAQTVTFALLLARTEGIEVTGRELREIGSDLRAEHSLMGRALELLTGDVQKDFKVTLDLLTRVIGAVNWPRIRRAKRDTYLHLYENFLDVYDKNLRKQSGSYYTPRPVVEEMVRLTEEALTSRLGKAAGFAATDVLTIDPAMGTGTYLHTILEHVAEKVAAEDGPGAVAGALGGIAQRLVGFELQMGPYTVAELRMADLLNKHSAPAKSRPRLFVTDTLDDPYAAQAQLGSGLQLIAQSRRRANKVKASENVTVVIGNPPYKELANGLGGWVENGSGDGKDARAILEDWYDNTASRLKAKLKNLYVYFWRWATWKVFESTPKNSGDAGVVCFITTSGYLTGDAFKGMRRYLRRWASEGWVIDVTPEGQTPDVPTRIFPGVRQPLAIGLFVRDSGKSADTPAQIRHRAIRGRQADKFEALASIKLDDEGWSPVRTGWTDPLTAAADGGWDDFPNAADLMPWYSPGVFPTRRWVVAPDPEILRKRWDSLRTEPDPERRSVMFKEGRDAHLDVRREPLPGDDTHRDTNKPLRADTVATAHPVRIGYRSFDRQWIIPDHRVMDMPRRDLWEARLPGQVFVTELHAHALKPGPALTFSALIPDFHFFKGSEGGRALPRLHPDGTANLAPGLLAALSQQFEKEVAAADVLAYVAGITGTPGFTRTFATELKTPGVRVPITADSGLFERAVQLGETVLWAHTYGETFTGSGRPNGNVRYPADDDRRPQAITAVVEVPETMSYDPDSHTLTLGAGTFAPVIPAVEAYQVGGKNVLKSWFDYRKATPGGKKTSPLDHIHIETWPAEWTSELIDLLTVLRRLVELEPDQAQLLGEILAGGLLSRADLAASGVRWPTGKEDRKVRHAVVTTDEGMLPLGEH